jgi:exodeoxyribonuclease VII small subunit
MDGAERAMSIEGGGKPPEEMTYEELVAALEALTERMASGTIGIEEAAELYEMAGALHAAAAARLAAVQERIERLRDDQV